MRRNTLQDFDKLKRIASELDASLADKVQHIVGVCIEPVGLNLDHIGLSVLIDDFKVFRQIPKTYNGYKVYIKLVNTPKFAFPSMNSVQKTV